jgi:ribonuclease HI
MRVDVKLYTDGSSTGKIGEGGWAFVLLDPKLEPIEGFGGEDNTTNNRMELMGAIEGLKEIYRLYGSSPNITVYSDSQYVVKGISEWITQWLVKIERGKEIKNQDLWLILKGLVDLFDSIKFEWIRGHSNIIYNDRCDTLAKQAKLTVKVNRSS